MQEPAPEDAPGLGPLRMAEDQARELLDHLSLLSHAARVFGSAMADLDVHVSWSLKPISESLVWQEDGEGRRAVGLTLDLARVVKVLDVPRTGREETYVEAFRAGFLFELGHLLYASRGEAGDAAARLAETSAEDLAPHVRELLARPAARELVETILATLNDARVESCLVRDFRGARRHLVGHADLAARMARSKTSSRLNRLVAALFLQIWARGDELPSCNLPPDVERLAEKLAPSCLEATETAHSLSSWVLQALIPEIMALLPTFPEDEDALPQRQEEDGDRSSQEGADGSEEEGRKEESELREMSKALRNRLAPPSLLSEERRSLTLGACSPAEQGLAENELIVYPHVDGGTVVVDEIPVVRAQSLPADARVRAVLEDVATLYGPPALEAFAAEASALRRAFQVNFERRFGGHYRSGRRIGIGNLRRYTVREDLRLFQRLEVPDRLSYYFHLLIDVSPSMLRDRNAQKAIAVGYAFTESLQRLRIPVDVSLYSSAISQLYDHRHDTLEMFFGETFGYFSTGTHEVEAIAFAKGRADAIDCERKLIVVITDGQPNNAAILKAGGGDLVQYFQCALIPWLQRARIDLLAIGIGQSPGYHRNSVGILSGWDSLAVLMHVLDEIVAHGEQSHRALWG